MKVAVDQIGAQGLTLAVRVHQDPWLLTTLEDAGNFRAPTGAQLNLQLRRELGEQVRMRGSVALSLEGACSRCADDIGFDLQTAVDVVLVPAEKQPKALDSGEIRSQDIDLGAYVDGEVDVGSILHDEILLDMPAQVLCTEDCLGRCGACGANHNDTDCGCADEVSPTSPFAPLAKLKRN